MSELNSSEVKDNEDNVDQSPYAYLNRDFSSENFKIEVKNLPKFYGYSQLRKLFNEKLKLNCNKIKTVRKNSPFAFVCFRNEEDKNKALEVLCGYMWKGKELQVTNAKAAPDPLVKKRNQDADDVTEINTKKMKLLPQLERLKDSTIPYWNIRYEEQINLKEKQIKEVLKKLGTALSHQNQDLQKWLENQKSIYDGLPCKLETIRFSEQIDGYRNKCEFTVGIDEETQLPTVGFRIGSYVNGTTGVGPIDDLVHIPQAMKTVVKVFQDYVRSSELKVFSPEFHTGHFKQLMVRSACESLMVVVGIHPQDLTKNQLIALKESLIDFFTKQNGKSANVTSLYYQKLVKKNRHSDHTSPEHLWGETHIYETLLGMKFKISPEAFFQVNTKGAEILYQAVIELAEPVGDCTVLDVCCGTGTIGLCFSKKCQQVLGIEIVPQAIVDAKENAVLNGVTNAHFFEGKAEEILGDICFKATSSNIVAVVDPPRAGLQKRAVSQLRKINKINKIVYVSCNPSAALENFIDFGRLESKKLQGDQLVPTKAIVVDMFPYTKHYELVIVFERWNNVNTSSE